jgi:hypothetical protein
MECGECKWCNPIDNPRKGLCIYERIKLSDTQKTSTAIKSKMINKNQGACEHFEKGSHRDNIDDLI